MQFRDEIYDLQPLRTYTQQRGLYYPQSYWDHWDQMMSRHSIPTGLYYKDNRWEEISNLHRRICAMQSRLRIAYSNKKTD